MTESPSSPSREVVLLDAQNPSAVIHMISDAMATSVLEAHASHPDLFTMDEKTLLAAMRDVQETPNITDHRLRMKFWLEYDNAAEQGRNKIHMPSIYAGVCARDTFNFRYLKNPWKVAWLLCPPTSYMLKAEEGLNFGLDQLRDVLDMPNYDKKGEPNTKLIAIKAKIVEMLENRVRGAIVQKTMTVNSSSVTHLIQSESNEALMKRLKELETANRTAQNIPITVGTTKVTEDI